jgi:hypothetical protein
MEALAEGTKALQAGHLVAVLLKASRGNQCRLIVVRRASCCGAFLFITTSETVLRVPVAGFLHGTLGLVAGKEDHLFVPGGFVERVNIARRKAMNLCRRVIERHPRLASRCARALVMGLHVTRATPANLLHPLLAFLKHFGVRSIGINPDIGQPTKAVVCCLGGGVVDPLGVARAPSLRQTLARRLCQRNSAPNATVHA